jgi:anti-sigma factor RsiW
MNVRADCGRTQELLSDRLEGSLEEPLRREVEAHLAQCTECRPLADTLAEVVAAFADFPTPLPSATLADRVAVAAMRKPVLARSPHVPAWIQSLAAGLALVVSGTVLLTTRSEAPRRAALRIVDTTVNTGSYLAERKDRLVEDVRVLQVVIVTAFEGRLDRMNERVEDYRRLLERRKQEPGAAEKKSMSTGARNFLNRAHDRAVTVS